MGFTFLINLAKPTDAPVGGEGIIQNMTEKL
jgi:hypothetical protein